MVRTFSAVAMSSYAGLGLRTSPGVATKFETFKLQDVHPWSTGVDMGLFWHFCPTGLICCYQWGEIWNKPNIVVFGAMKRTSRPLPRAKLSHDRRTGLSINAPKLENVDIAFFSTANYPEPEGATAYIDHDEILRGTIHHTLSEHFWTWFVTVEIWILTICVIMEITVRLCH